MRMILLAFCGAALAWAQTGVFPPSVPSAVANVKAFGATGDGVTDDTSAISAAIASIQSTGGGKLSFPPGKYITTGGFTLSAPVIVEAAGQASHDGTQYGTKIVCTTPTCTLFTVTAKVALFRDIALENTSGSPTAGAGIFTNSTDFWQRVNFENVSVAGFYDDIHVGVGSSWSLRSSHIQYPVRYGLYVQNTVNADEGDWVVEGNYFSGSAKTSTSLSSAIYVESAGGGKIWGNKINKSNFVDGIRLNLSGSVQTLINHNDVENVSGIPINIVQGWPFIIITDNFLKAPAGKPAIFCTNMNGFYIGGGHLEVASPGSPAAIVIENSNNGTIGPVHANANFVKITTGAGHNNIVDLNNVTPSSGGETLRVNCADAGCGATATIDLADTSQSEGHHGSISSSWVNAGIVFTAPRDLSNKGFVFRSNGGAARAFLDSSNGNLQLGTAGAALILKSADGTCYPVTVPNGGGSLAVGASVTCPY